MRVRSIALAAASVVVALGLTSAPAQADHSWGSYHWARSGAVKVNVLDSVTSTWDGHLSTANNDWNRSAYLENTLVGSDTSDRIRKRCPKPAGAVRACNYTYGRNGWLGLASINVSGGHISAAYTKVNDSYFNSAPYNTSAWRQFVMCQEIGHDWGLDHQDENFNNPNLGTCMDYTNDPGTNQHPNQHDYDQLASIYSHSDGGAAGGGATVIRTGNTVTKITWAQ
ncbi:MAG: hypothetical protein ACRDT4_27450 [Micromonosporaceae bacterium]